MTKENIQLSVKDLHKRFDSDLLKASIDVLKGVNLEIKKGEIYGFLGPNGAGKTTTIKAITGLIKPDKGKIEICGHKHTSSAAKKKLGFMPERPGFYNHLSGRELLMFYTDLLGISEQEAKKKVSELLETVGMTKKANQKLGSYSKGMAQRIALAQALLNDPQLVILDEPLSGLDPIGRSDFRKIILSLKEKGVTVFFSSHIIPDVESICDRVAILLDGKVIAEGEIEEIVSLEVEEFEISFAGSSTSIIGVPTINSTDGTDSSLITVRPEDKDKAVEAILASGAELLRLLPVRKTLEDKLVEKIRS